MFLISWNVAGWGTSVQRIHEHYGNSSNNNNNNNNGSKKRPKLTNSSTTTTSPLTHYLERHGSPDILCLQEHKIPISQLSNRSEPKGCAHLEGYESFWSCCTDEKSKGMNGVVTYAKKGTVVSANARPLGDASLDDQGRCVLTDHGTFVVFNVYVPANGGTTVARKMRFLQRLRRAMQHQRTQHNKAVLLVGDLNISHGPLDVYWKHQVIHVNDILRQVAEHTHNNSSHVLPQWKLQLAHSWPLITETLQTKHVLPTQTTNPRTGAKYERYRLAVTTPTDNNNNNNPATCRTVYLGKHESCEDYCYHGFCFEEAQYYDDPETDERVPVCEPNVVSIAVLAELMVKIAGHCNDWSDEAFLKHEIAASPDAGRSRVNPPRQWLTALLQEDDMVDVFRALYPTAQARFTCWHQFTNTRYSNNGTRIDYTMVDRSLMSFVEPGGPLRTGELIPVSTPTSSLSLSPSCPTALPPQRSNPPPVGHALTTGVESCSTATTIATTTTTNSTISTCTESTSVATSATLNTADSTPTELGDPHNTTRTNNGKKLKKELDPLSEEAALAATTAKGLFEPVSFEGGGIVEARQHALDTQFGPPHTGIIYTPPSYSDHVAVSILLGEQCSTENKAEVRWRSENWGNFVLNEKDPDTRRSQPHKAQKSIASFFGSSNSSNSGTSKVPAATKKFANSNQIFLPKKRKENTLRSFFQPKPKQK